MPRNVYARQLGNLFGVVLRGLRRNLGIVASAVICVRPCLENDVQY